MSLEFELLFAKVRSIVSSSPAAMVNSSSDIVIVTSTPSHSLSNEIVSSKEEGLVIVH